jgi:hypothetical protein
MNPPWVHSRVSRSGPPRAHINSPDYLWTVVGASWLRIEVTPLSYHCRTWLQDAALGGSAFLAFNYLGRYGAYRAGMLAMLSNTERSYNTEICMYENESLSVWRPHGVCMVIKSAPRNVKSHVTVIQEKMLMVHVRWLRFVRKANSASYP